MYQRSKLWRTLVTAANEGDYKREASELIAAYQTSWERASALSSRISHDLPGLTLHDDKHLSAVWSCSELLIGQDAQLNPIEIFVLGMSILIHDIGHTQIAYSGRIDEIRSSTTYKDILSTKFSEEHQLTPDEEQLVLFDTLRQMHAQQASEILLMKYDGDQDTPLFILQDQYLRENLADRIGRIAASHHWDHKEISTKLKSQSPAPGKYPQGWTIREQYLASILRCADAIQIDERRAPSFDRSLNAPQGISKQHWTAQNRLNPAIVSDTRPQALRFTSKRPFNKSEIEAWWIAHDLIQIANNELQGCASLLADMSMPPLSANRIEGAEDPKHLSEYLETDDAWTPVKAEIRLSSVERIIDYFGGEKLYGNKPDIPLRELIQNGIDAIRAREGIENNPTMNHRVLVETALLEDGDIKLTVSDTGLGMSEQVLTGTLLEFGKSLWKSSDITTEFPGLASKRLPQTGRYGIGFFSIFMIAKSVRVLSSRFDQSTIHCLEFSNNINMRPILTKGTSNDLMGYSTRIELVIPPKTFEELLQHTYGYGYRKNIVKLSLKEKVATVAPTAPCDLYTLDRNVSNNPVEQHAHSKDWFSLDGEVWLKQIYPHLLKDSRFTSRLQETAQRLSLLYSKDEKRVVGRAAIFPTSFETLGYVDIGGLCSEYGEENHDGYVGVLPGVSSGPARKVATWAETEPSLEDWATDQANRISTSSNTKDLHHACLSIATFGGNVEKIAHVEIEGTLLSLPDLAARLEQQEELYVAFDYHYRLGTLISHVNHENADDLDFQLEEHEVEYKETVIENWFMTKSHQKYYAIGGTNNLSCFIDCFRKYLKDRGVDFEEEDLVEHPLAEYIGDGSDRDGVYYGDTLYSDCIKITKKS